MNKRRWLAHIVFRALVHRRGRTLLLLAVLTLASSLATALGLVSASMRARVAEETRKYGANLVVVPESARVEVGSGGLHFGAIGEPAYLSQEQFLTALAKSGVKGDYSFHLEGALTLKGVEIPCEGVDFAQVRRLSPWWQVDGDWPREGEVLGGGDLTPRHHVHPGDLFEFGGGKGVVRTRVSGVVTTGGDEDDTLFIDLKELQEQMGRPGQVSEVRLLADPGNGSLKDQAALLQRHLSGAVVKELRQVGRTSEDLLGKVQLLMLLVTAVVLVTAGSSVAGTMSTTVLERGKEIGLMKAMGGSRWDLLKIFSAEALLLGVGAGVGGFLLGVVIAKFVAHSVFAADAALRLEFLPVAVGVSMLLALAGSVGPLLSVFRLDPVQSLRGE
ncbi:ABC transporter permease [Geomonas propionica]|uniref:FtsX-like permease family protein n=1 Tax=Geomonas propionica TaxID=2798582 RepID=A0ABS0YXS5_9BACT|nr:FtsX-like permease family protein [Geomonas propionica]MBJ6802750.1 FtsX-like permease family protein [Geomonas propionica]